MEIPAGGVTIDQVQPRYRQWFIDAAAQHNVPLTFLLNIYGAETTLGTIFSNTPTARGIMQIGDTTASDWGINNRDPRDSIFGAARMLRTYTDRYGDPYLAAIAYNAGPGNPNDPNPTRGLLAYQVNGWGALRSRDNETPRYVANVMRGVGPSPPGLAEYLGTTVGMPGGGTIFDTYPHAGSGGIQFEPRAAERSAAAGYELSPEVQQFLDMTAPELGGGPGSFDPNNPFPWQNPGRIGEAAGGILQHHALMPNNLVYNPETQAWDVPNTQRFPGGTGIWGSESVAGWLSEVDPATAGAGQDYLRHLGYGAPDPGTPSQILPVPSNWPNSQIPGVMTAGVDLSHWLAQQYGQQNSGMNFGGNIYDASGNFGTRGNVYDASGIPQTRDLYEQYRGNVYDASDIPQTRDLYEQAIGGVANPATYTGPDYSQYFGALGRGGYGLPSPGTYSGPGVGALPTPGTYANQDVGMTGLGYQGSSGITNLPDMTLAHQIGAGQLSNWVAQMNSAAHYSPLAASPGPVVYGSPGLGSQFSFPATNSGQIFGASGFTPASNSGLQYAVGGPPVY